MLAFGVKVAWFALSLSGLSGDPARVGFCLLIISIGLLGSFAAVPAFAQALDGYLLPAVYTFLNCILQGLFCLGKLFS